MGNSNNQHHGHEAHGTVKLYVIFAVVLCVITFIEWFIFKHKESMGLSNPVMVVVLLGLSLIKFIMVCGWYMHLRYDRKILTKMFVAAMAISLSVFIVVKLLA